LKRLGAVAITLTDSDDMSYFPEGLRGTGEREGDLTPDGSPDEIVSNSNASDTAVDTSSSVSSNTPPLDPEKEKALPIYTLEEIIADTAEDDIDEEAVKDLPWHVRRIVSLHDDPTLPTITFRYFLLVAMFIPPGAFLSQLNMFRTTYAPYSIFFVQIVASYAGDWLANTLPAWNVRIPFTKWSFNLNPGPFSVKEHVLVVIAAASGATYNVAYTPLVLSELYFHDKVNPAIWIIFMLAITLTGYSYAAIARQFLVYDPQQPW
jgi:hypothetical protein